MGKESKTSKQKLLLLSSIAQYLDRCGFSLCFKILLSEAKIKKKDLNSTLPDLEEVYCKFLWKAKSNEKKVSKKRRRSEPENDQKVEADDEQKFLLLCSIAQYLEGCGFSKCFKKLLSDAKIEKKDLNSTLPDLEEVFLMWHDAEMKVSKKRRRSEPDDNVEEDDEHFQDEVFQESKEEHDLMTNAFKEITGLLKHAQELLVTTAGMEKFQTKTGIMPNSNLEDQLSSLTWSEVLFSWTRKRPEIIPETQRQEFDDCWSVALSRGQNVAVLLSGDSRPLLNPKKLRDGVSCTHQNDGRGLERVEHARTFMVGRYVDEMIVHRRPMEDYQDFEILMEKLLCKGPVAVSYDLLPTYSDYAGKGIYIPTDLECQARAYEKFPGHSVLLTGCGVQLKDGEMIEFWESMDSQGRNWGEMGFGRLARRKGLIREVIQLKVDGPSPP